MSVSTNSSVPPAHVLMLERTCVLMCMSTEFSVKCYFLEYLSRWSFEVESLFMICSLAGLTGNPRALPDSASSDWDCKHAYNPGLLWMF